MGSNPLGATKWRVVRVVIWSSAKALTQVRILYSPHPVKDKGVSPGIELGKWFDSTNCEMVELVSYGALIRHRHRFESCFRNKNKNEIKLDFYTFFTYLYNVIKR